KQDEILRLLAEQSRSIRNIVQNAVISGNFYHDVQMLIGEASAFNTTLAYSSSHIKSDRLTSSSLTVDALCTTIGTYYGLSAVPAYLSAIALQNAIYYILPTPPLVFVAANIPHRTLLDNMLNGTGSTSITSIIKSDLGDADA